MKRLILAFILMLAFAMPARAAVVIGDTEIETVIYELVEPLAKAAGIPDNRLRVHIINDDEFNAFVMGGEDVFIYTGLITAVKNPNAFQAVIAHELGHMVGGHMAQLSAQMSAEMTRSLVMQALGVALMVANPMLGMGVMAGAGGMAKQGLLAFSRDEERMADNMGLDLLVKAGVSTDGFVEIMQQMNNMSGYAENRVNPNNINHPLTTERMQNIKEHIKHLKSKTENRKPKTDLQNKYNMVRAKLIGYLSSESIVINTFPKTDVSNAAIYARSIRAMRSGDLENAKTGASHLISKNSNNPYFYELLGDIEYQYGHYDDSINAYEKSVKILPRASQIQTALALVLSERKKDGDIDRAIEMAKRANLTEKSPLAFFVLAKSYQARGETGISDWAFAEYYAMMKNTKKSQKYARDAQRVLPKDSPEYIKAGDLLR